VPVRQVVALVRGPAIGVVGAFLGRVPLVQRSLNGCTGRLRRPSPRTGIGPWLLPDMLYARSFFLLTQVPVGFYGDGQG
jgi:hypothetical protein